jgi:hypothetical protein
VKHRVRVADRKLLRRQDVMRGVPERAIGVEHRVGVPDRKLIRGKHVVRTLRGANWLRLRHRVIFSDRRASRETQPVQAGDTARAII